LPAREVGRGKMSKPVLAVLGNFTEEVEPRIARDFAVRRVSTDAPAGAAANPAEELLRAAEGADAIFFNPPARLDAEFFRRVARSVKVIATFSVGYDHIDVGAAAARGIAIANTPGVLDDATADVAILLLLGALSVWARNSKCSWAEPQELFLSSEIEIQNYFIYRKSKI